jgi:hypothetical protein
MFGLGWLELLGLGLVGLFVAAVAVWLLRGFARKK